jgi:hypothetical protein
MVWYGAPPTPRQCVLSLRVVASCSVHPVSERHRQALQSALVRRWVRPCDAGIGKECNRGGCLHQTKSSGISLRCTCLALPATRWLDDPRERAVHCVRLRQRSSLCHLLIIYIYYYYHTIPLLFTPMSVRLELTPELTIEESSLTSSCHQKLLTVTVTVRLCTLTCTLTCSVRPEPQSPVRSRIN